MLKHYPLRLNIFLTIILAATLAGCQFGFKYQDPSSKRGVGVYHALRSGQTLSTISQAYGVDLGKLQRVNNIPDPSKVQVGQRIWIPNAHNVLKIPGNEKARRVAKKKSPHAGNPYAVT